MRVGLAASLRARPGATCMRRRAHDTPIDRIPSFRPDSRDQVVIVTEVGAKPSRQGLTAEAMGVSGCWSQVLTSSRVMAGPTPLAGTGPAPCGLGILHRVIIRNRMYDMSAASPVE